MRQALIIGIDYYKSVNCLTGCANDARNVNAKLECNANGLANFDTELIVSDDSSNLLQRSRLRSKIEDLFKEDHDISLLYFAGHGHVEPTGGYLCASDSSAGNDGVSLADIMYWANTSKARNRIVILDSCHSGFAGNDPIAPVADIAEGVTVLAASTASQYASEKNGSGVFTNLLVDALDGGAANLMGDITPSSIYAHIDQSLGAKAQRPVFKTNVKAFISLRNVGPTVQLNELLRITEFFPYPGFEFQLDPSFEPERSEYEKKSATYIPPNPVNTEKFAILQKYNRVNLLIPVDAPHMWHAAMNSKTCRLTALGEHYRRLVAEKMI